jgi:hypothetical protein
VIASTSKKEWQRQQNKRMSNFGQEVPEKPERRLSTSSAAAVASPLDMLYRKTSVAHRKLSMNITSQQEIRSLMNTR